MKTLLTIASLLALGVGSANAMQPGWLYTAKGDTVTFTYADKLDGDFVKGAIVTSEKLAALTPKAKHVKVAAKPKQDKKIAAKPKHDKVAAATPKHDKVVAAKPKAKAIKPVPTPAPAPAK